MLSDAVAYGYTKIEHAGKAREAEFRGAGGRQPLGLGQRREKCSASRNTATASDSTGIAFKVPLKKGVNTVLVKVCQAPLEEPNWEFFLRHGGFDGKGFGVFRDALKE